MRSSPILLAAAVSAALLPAVAFAQAQADAADLDRVVVTSGPLRGVAAFDTPASVSRIAVDGNAATAGVHVSEFLDAVPGLVARDRGNYAQDLQLSLRGFGARATFGVRGLRLYADGIPATMPDGQGQVSHFALAGAERIEVLRGPFSALHGNSSGGVLQLWTADGVAPTQGHVQASSGRHASHALSAGVRGGGGASGYALSLSRFETDGWRAHSAARRTTFNGKWHLDTARGGRLQVVANALDAPDAQDPLGLTWTQYRADPRQVAPVATQFDTRKSVAQRQLGMTFEQPVGDGHVLRAMAYGGQREVEQFLALPVAAQANPLNAGGVIDLDGGYHGFDLRWNWTGLLADRPFEVAIGGNADAMRQHRRGFENFIGEALGVRGALRRDERNRVRNLDQYAQAWWQVAPRWAVQAGVRRSRVDFRADDDYITDSNPDDSGRVRYAQTTPVAGVVFSPHDDARVYLSAGRGFETPTFNELGYRADGGAGLAFDLRPATSRNVELGAKWRAGAVRVEAALFRATTDDEIAVARNVAGRSSFRNVGRSVREGIEIGATLPFAEAWQAQLAYTWIDARFRDGFPLCVGAGCTEPVERLPPGTAIPGVPRQQLFTRLQWQRADWRLALEAQAIASVSVNDRGSERAPGHALAHVEASRQWAVPHGTLRAFLRIDNLLDRTHVGSIIVNEGNGRFHEPGPGRGVLAGLRWQWAAGDNH
ncbi:TonB-dependent receptor [Luteimonas aestuarii]|uniref:TonB-dependent receptor n=1 Tax=Luteimonas aestuarii TaxID=453837 RepID=A0A4R5TSB5_9GAMM|nr:TonB-dependent receptor [Luteimonas aestuarii]TDK23732.1 TonB-dependent receptor [Luteimonas aestuarii]